MPFHLMLECKRGKGESMSTETIRNAGTDLIRVHKLITRAITVSNWYSRASGPKPDLRAGFQSYERALVIFLDSHHSGEDEVAFPFVEKKHPDALFDQLRDDHRRIMDVLNEINAWIDKGSGAWESVSLVELNKTIRKGVVFIVTLRVPSSEGKHGCQLAQFSRINPK
jgi:hypothetical protein